MSFSLAIKEGLSGFRRAKLSTAVSVLTISISLILLGMFAIVTKNAASLVESIRNKVEIEAFLTEPFKSSDADSLRAKILSLLGVEKVTFISKEDAAKIFKQEFGEDIHRVLDFNPLPPSFKVTLKEGFRTAERAEEIQKQIQHLKGVDDVVYRKAILQFIDKRVRTFSLVALGLGILITLSAIVLVSNTIRLAIYSKQQVVQSTEPVDATSGFTRLPFILEGVSQGFLGGAIASAVIYLLVEVVFPRFAPELTELLSADYLVYSALVIVGTVLGFIGSLFSVRTTAR
ncbi:MAG: permease-like cell division protein FtsX [Bacteroidota bacterium]